MKAISAREAKYNFGRMIDTARAEPVIVKSTAARWWSCLRWRNTKN